MNNLTLTPFNTRENRYRKENTKDFARQKEEERKSYSASCIFLKDSIIIRKNLYNLKQYDNKNNKSTINISLNQKHIKTSIVYLNKTFNQVHNIVIILKEIKSLETIAAHLKLVFSLSAEI